MVGALVHMWMHVTMHYLHDIMYVLDKCNVLCGESTHVFRTNKQL